MFTALSGIMCEVFFTSYHRCYYRSQLFLQCHMDHSKSHCARDTHCIKRQSPTVYNSNTHLPTSKWWKPEYWQSAPGPQGVEPWTTTLLCLNTVSWRFNQVASETAMQRSSCSDSSDLLSMSVVNRVWIVIMWILSVDIRRIDVRRHLFEVQLMRSAPTTTRPSNIACSV